MSNISPDHAARSHHKFGMSRLPYIEDCSGFQNGESSDAAKAASEEGTASHELMDKVAARVSSLLKHEPRSVRKFADVLPFVLVDEPRLVEDWEKSLLEFCCREVDKFLASAPPALIENEIKVYLVREDGSELNHGHLDLLLVFGGDYGVILDYKFGWKLVPPAKDNLQGLGYGLGVFNRHQKLNRLGVVFIQPKLNRVSTRILHRHEYPAVYNRIETAIARATASANLDPGSEEFAKHARPGPYCAYCALKGKCAAQLQQASLAVAEYQRQPISIDWSKLSTPAEIAKARYLVDVLENMIDEVKSKAREVAELNGGRIETVLPNGDVIAYEVSERSVPRVLGESGLIADLLATEYDITPMEVLAAADLSLSKLTPMGAKVIQDRANIPADKELVEAEAYWNAEKAAGRVKATEAKEKLSAAKREIKARKLTKLEAEAQFYNVLEAEGLISRPDTKIKYLKLKRETTKQLTQ